MKSIRVMFIAVFAIVTSPLFAQQSAPANIDTIKVNGECGMCKNRIQKALKLEGISAATWDTDTKLLSVTYNPAVITNEAIQKRVAAVGHDTEKFKAEDTVYNKLPGCCKYEREKAETKQGHSQHH